jgi:hypothetical protein
VHIGSAAVGQWNAHDEPQEPVLGGSVERVKVMPVSGREFRVVWRREGQRRKAKIYQTRQGAERWALILQGRIQEPTGDDPDDYACCPGYECGCGGITNADVWGEETAKVPALMEGPTIESRLVGEWLS